VETRYLKAFLKIAETGSISRASESLGVSQPTLSQQLSRLEEEVGVTLFRRTARGVTLTEAGQLFRQHAHQLLHWTDIAIEDVRKLNDQPSGEVVLAVPYSVSRIAGMPLIEAFLQRAPLLRFRLVEALTGQIRGWLEASKVDLGIVNDLGPMRNLLGRPIASEELYLVGPRGKFHSGAPPVSVSVADFAAFPLLLPGPQHGLRQVIEQQLAALGIAMNVRLDIDALMHIPALIAAGYGYSILPLPAVTEELRAGNVSVARIGDGTLRRTLCLLRNTSDVATHASVYCEALTIKVLLGLIDSGDWVAQPPAQLA
jgi:LysR family transcriptional regulator, nitrogen assimilation regulatory protein